MSCQYVTENSSQCLKDLVVNIEERRQERIRIEKEKEREEIRQYWEEQKRLKEIDKQNQKQLWWLWDNKNNRY